MCINKYEESEILPYVWATKLAATVSQMLVEGMQSLSQQLLYTSVNECECFVYEISKSHSHGSTQRGAGGYLEVKWVALQERSPEFRETNLL